MVSRVRSSSGCWTCRLRRNKCDEVKPRCRRCSKLHLECSYSERPIWMDAGELQKCKLEETKQLVKKRTTTSSKRNMESTTLTDQQNSYNESDLTSLVPADEKLADSNFLLDSNGLAAENDYLSSELPSAHFSGINYESFFSGDESYRSEFGPLTGDEKYDHYNIQEEISSDYEKSHSPIGLAVLKCKSVASAEDIASLIPQTLVSANFDADTTGLQNGYNFEVDTNPIINSGSVGFTHHSVSSISSASSTKPSASGYQMSNFQKPSTPAEADLLLYYMEDVCEKQFLVLTKADRGSLYMAITKFELPYWATLGLACYCKGSVDSLEMAHFYTNLAILELRKTFLLLEYEEQSFSQVLLCCFSIIQLMFLEKLSGNHEACKMHLDAACNLLANLKRNRSMDGLSDTDPVNSTMLHLTVGTLRWFDVLLSCSLHSLPTTSAQLPDLLQVNNHTTKLSDGFACQSLVLSALIESLELDHWKAAAATQGRLSVGELVNRASAIERNIASAQSLVEQSEEKISASIDKSCGNELFPKVMNIFIAITRVYLQVIVSGSYRQVAEIEQAVSNTITLFKQLSSTEISTYLVWPFCFVGCLTTGSDREIVTSLAENVTSQVAGSSNLKSAYAVVKECWRLLDEEVMLDPDWSSAMKSLACPMTLL